MKQTTKQLTLGAVLIALLAILQLFNTLTGNFFTNFAPFVYPIVFIVYCRQNTLQWSLSMYLAGIIVVFMISSLPHFIMVLMYGLVGVFYGQAIKKGLNNIQLIIYSSFFITLISIVTSYLFASFFGLDLNTELAYLNELISYISPLIIYSVIIVVTSIMEAVVITMLVSILFHYLKMNPIRVIRMRNYRVGVKTSVISLLLLIISLMMNVLVNHPALMTLTILFGCYQLLLILIFIVSKKRV